METSGLAVHIVGRKQGQKVRYGVSRVARFRSGLIVRCGNELSLHGLAVAIGNVQRSTPTVEGFEEVRIVVSLALNALPGKNRVIAWTQAAESEMSALVAHSFAIVVDPSPHPGVGN